ncbi:hypothetical protein F5B17DRAFT_196025 [Nemania serpens]|nr:hypothetical protein F5B17DRAFT_196025 [Nemania serpens]
MLIHLSIYPASRPASRDREKNRVPLSVFFSLSCPFSLLFRFLWSIHFITYPVQSCSVSFLSIPILTARLFFPILFLFI